MSEEIYNKYLKTLCNQSYHPYNPIIQHLGRIWWNWWQSFYKFNYLFSNIYSINPKSMVFTLKIRTDRSEQTVDPDQMLHNAASDQGLHCLSYIKLI